MKIEVERKQEIVDWVMDWTLFTKQWKQSYQSMKSYFSSITQVDPYKYYIEPILSKYPLNKPWTCAK